jgi:hypothetical protein
MAVNNAGYHLLGNFEEATLPAALFAAGRALLIGCPHASAVASVDEFIASAMRALDPHFDGRNFDSLFLAIGERRAAAATITAGGKAQEASSPRWPRHAASRSPAFPKHFRLDHRRQSTLECRLKRITASWNETKMALFY